MDLERDYKANRRKHTGVKVIIFITVILSILMGSFTLSYKYVIDSSNSSDADVAINIDPDDGIPLEIKLGSSTSTIANLLKEKEIIKYPTLFKIMSNLNGYDNDYKSGTHIVSKQLGYDELMRVLTSNPVSIKVTIPEGYTINQIADTLIKKKLISDKDKFLKAANIGKFDFKFLQGLPQRDLRLEGYLFPDTYEFGLNVGEEEIIRSMLNNFNDRFKPEYYDQIKELNKRYPKLNMTMDKVITMASIIEREAKAADERATIAGVFYNRLSGKNNAPKKLESCATIQYVYSVKDMGISEENKTRIMKGIINDNDTKVDNPYNTYKYEGLPAGPISSPGKASIEAALNPADTEYLYFVVNKDGSGRHVFTKTLQQHLNATKENKIN